MSQKKKIVTTCVVLSMLLIILTPHILHASYVEVSIPEQCPENTTDIDGPHFKPSGAVYYICTIDDGSSTISGAGSATLGGLSVSPPICSPIYNIWCWFKTGVALFLMRFGALILFLAVGIFNFAIKHLVLDMGNLIRQVSGIRLAWVVVRDITNMAFIFMLLYIAIATVLRIEEYGARRLLARIVIIALLINFSFFFTRVVIDASNVLTSEFIHGIERLSVETDVALSKENTGFDSGLDRRSLSGIEGAFVNPLKLTTFYSVDNGKLTKIVTGDNMLILGVSAFMFFCVAAFIFAAGALLLIVRFIAFIILMITSPLAFAGMILPYTRGFARQWWERLLNYAIFGPVYAGLLLATAVVINSTDFQATLGGAGGFTDIFGASEQQAAGAFPVILNFMIISGLMASALIVAQQLGIKGAQQLSSIGKRLAGAPLGGAAFLGRRAAVFAGRKWNEWTTSLLEEKDRKKASVGKRALFAVLNPVAAARGWEERSEELARLARSTAAQGGREVVEQALTTPIANPANWISRGEERRKLREHGWLKAQLALPYRQMDERRDENEFMQDYTEMRKESLMAAAEQAAGMKGAEGSLRRRAIVKAAATQGYLDDLLRVRSFAEKYGEADGTIYSPKVLNRFLYGYLGDDEQAMRFMAEDMENLGKQTGHYEYLGHAYFDPDTGVFQRGYDVVGKTDGIGKDKDGNAKQIDDLKDIWQGSYAANELSKVTGRERLRIAPHNFVPMRAEIDNETGEFIETGREIRSGIVMGSKDGHLEDFYKAILHTIGPGDLRELHHSQSRTKEWLLSKAFNRNTGEITLDSPEEVATLQSLWHENPEYMRGLYGQLFGYDYKTSAEKLPGIKVAYYDKENGRLRKIRVGGAARIGDSEGVPHPIIAKATDTFANNPDIKLSEMEGGQQGKDAKKIRAVVERNVRDIFGGRKNASDLAAELRDATEEITLPKGVTPESMAQKAVETIGRELRQNYDPSLNIKKIDRALSLKKLEKLGVAEESALMHALPEAYAKVWEGIVAERKDFDSEEAAKLLHEEFREAIRGINGDLLTRIENVGGVDLLVEEVRPAARHENSTDNEQRDLPFEDD